MGAVEDVEPLGEERRFGINPLFHWDALNDGESIMVNGVCLSVERHSGSKFYAYASRETISRSTLGSLRVGTKVNLERALAAGDKIGGHLVSGHVDCVAKVTDADEVGESRRIRCSFPARYAVEVLEKGSIALDGISLTINRRGEDFLEVNVIPDSLKRTNISQWRPGTLVNMEMDAIGKYVINYMRYSGAIVENKDGLTRDFLARNGFI